MPKILQPVVFGTFLLAILVGACSRKVMVHRYYVLELTVPADSLSPAPAVTLPAPVEVLPVEVAPAFSGRRIALRRASHEITYFVYHQWAVPFDQEVEHVLKKWLRHSSLYHPLSAAAERVPAYQIACIVNQVEMVEQKGKLLAHLNMELRLQQVTGGQILVQHRFNRIQPLPDRRANNFARAISNMMGEELQKFRRKIIRFVQRSRIPQTVQ